MPAKVRALSPSRNPLASVPDAAVEDTAVSVRWSRARARIEDHLRRHCGGGSLIRLGVYDGRVEEIDRVDPSSLVAPLPERGVRRVRLVSEGHGVELIVPSSRRVPATAVSVMLASVRELFDLTPAAQAWVVLERSRVAYHSAGAPGWFEWPPWDQLIQWALRQPRVLLGGAFAEAVPLQGATPGTLVSVRRVSPLASVDQSAAHPVPQLFGLELSRADRDEVREPGAHWIRSVLTKRQFEVVRLLLGGQTNKEIASALGCSEVTVEKHLTQVFRRTGVSSRSRLAARVLDPRR